MNRTQLENVSMLQQNPVHDMTYGNGRNGAVPCHDVNKFGWQGHLVATTDCPPWPWEVLILSQGSRIAIIRAV